MRYLVILLALAACGGDDVLSPLELQDPATCMQCHPDHHTEWSGSMHAYATDDPVFQAMNKRGQREADIGVFCLSCHAPMAVANGTITDANAKDFDLSTLGPTERGVTCYFCHNVDRIEADHNNGLVLANDSTMRGGLTDPVDSPAHHSKYAELMDGDINKSEMCGSCHDVVNGHGVRIERSFQEWQSSVFANPEFAALNLSCASGCHMPSRFGLVAEGPGLNTTVRDKPAVHSHMWPGIDQALVPFPEADAQRAAIQKLLDSSLTIKGPVPRDGPTKVPGGICIEQPGTISVRIDNIGSGHAWPSGSAFDRRAWLEVIAYRADNSVVFQSGVVPDGMDPEDIGDDNLLGMWDRVYKADDTEAHFFWEITRNDPSSLLKVATTNDPFDPAYDHSLTKKYVNVPNLGEIDHITARVRIRAFPHAVLDELVSSGDLAPGYNEKLVTLDVGGATKTWNAATAGTGNAENTGCSPM
jgi:hypothetical protein